MSKQLFKGWHHYGVMCRDMEESIAFYRDALGFEFMFYAGEMEGADHIKIAFMKNDKLVLELLEPVSWNQEACDWASQGMNHIAFAVGDCDAMQEKLEKEFNVVFTDPEDGPDCKAVFFRGPGGERLELIEMKPLKHSPAHSRDTFAELVCSNSLRSDALTNAVGLLKEEMRMCGSLIMEAAEKTKVPAGSALAVDRDAFSQYVTDQIRSHPLIHITAEEIAEIPEGPAVIATGPLTSQPLAEAIGRLTGNDSFYFYDAAAPIVTAESIDMTKAYRKSRYDKGSADYINCPMDKEQFDAFYEALITAETAEMHAFEKEVYFEVYTSIHSTSLDLTLIYSLTRYIIMNIPRNSSSWLR